MPVFFLCSNKSCIDNTLLEPYSSSQDIYIHSIVETRFRGSAKGRLRDSPPPPHCGPGKFPASRMHPLIESRCLEHQHQTTPTTRCLVCVQVRFDRWPSSGRDNLPNRPERCGWPRPTGPHTMYTAGWLARWLAGSTTWHRVLIARAGFLLPDEQTFRFSSLLLSLLSSLLPSSSL